MPARIIDFDPGHPAQRFSIALNGAVFTLKFYKSSRTQKWYMSVLDSRGTHLLSGIRLVSAWSLLASQDYSDKMPEVFLYLLDSTGAQRPADGELLGNDVKIHYAYSED